MGLLESIFNHLVLPPDIPGAQDSDLDALARDILERLVRATTVAQNAAEESPWKDAYHSLQCSFETCAELNNGSLERRRLFRHLQDLAQGQVLILYINEQNAGLLIRRDIQ
jgi:hypothetical protein